MLGVALTDSSLGCPKDMFCINSHVMLSVWEFFTIFQWDSHSFVVCLGCQRRRPLLLTHSTDCRIYKEITLVPSSKDGVCFALWVFILPLHSYMHFGLFTMRVCFHTRVHLQPKANSRPCQDFSCGQLSVSVSQNLTSRPFSQLCLLQLQRDSGAHTLNTCSCMY